MAKHKTIINHSFCGCKFQGPVSDQSKQKKKLHFSFSWVKKKSAFGQTYHVKIMWVKQCHLHHPHSHDHFYRWYVYNSQSWLVYDIVLPKPICSMYGIVTNICPKNHPNVGKYTIHGVFYPKVTYVFPVDILRIRLA